MSAMVTFLERVWSKQPHPGYATIARKYSTGEWTERSVRSDGLRLHGSKVDDLYFTPCVFSKPDHKSQHALPSRWLYADLDEARTPDELEPTLLWRTSPGRHQALWLIDRPLKRGPFEDLNRKLTYYVSADKSGWDAGQLLRIPGSVSTKHGFRHKVRLLATTRRVYSYHELAALLRHVQAVPATTAALPRLPDALGNAEDVLAKHRSKLPAAVLITLRADVATGDRSAELWHLYRRLFQVGLTAEKVFVLAQASVWNKWRRRPDRLWQDVCKAQQRYESGRCSAGRADPSQLDPLVARTRKSRSRV